MLPDNRWSLHEARLEPGETFVVVSDGLLDHFHRGAAAEATARVVAQAGSAEEAVQSIGRLGEGGPATDEQTAVAVRRTA